ncbi:alkaline phosphatase family protein, partial [Pseudomonas sp. 2,4-D]|nr:alkaline phosphatase family protein [Pseudomonas sp. 2,4-D]
MTSPNPLPLVLAGPVLRRLEPQRLAVWLVTTQPLQPEFVCLASEAQVDCQVVPIGRHAYVHLLDIQFASP